ncbi:Gfo/Idh/MocA family protein [Salibacterium lacus]|uniref:Gfo/Idh/MocA family protein n=1 Tax=Salibacterium lacus TaxID=1898109 RepID=A0ABW5T457_9BACI
MLKVGVIGVGAISSSHVEGYLEVDEEIQIAALCDLYEDKAETINKKYELNASVYTDYEKMLENEELDLVSICTPPFTHSDIAIKAMEHRTHVLVEKPMASSLEECDRMLEASEKYDVILSVIAQNRFKNPMMKLSKLLSDETIGSINHTQIDSHWWRGFNYYDLWWRGTWEKEGGGCTLNHAVHHIDIFQWLRGAPAEISAFMSNTAHTNAEVEDLSIAIFRHEDGGLSQVTSSAVHHGEEQKLIFQGDKAKLEVPFDVKAYTQLENGFPETNETLQQSITETYNQLEPLRYEGHTGQIHDVIQAVKGNKAPLVTGEEGRKTLEIIMAIYEAATEKKHVTLPLTKDSSFYSRESLLNHAPHFYEKQNSVDNFQNNEISVHGDYE